MYVLQMVVDCLAVAVPFLVLTFTIRPFQLSWTDGLLLLTTLATFVVVSIYTRAYSYQAVLSLHVAIARVFHAWFVTLAIVLLILFTGKSSAEFSRRVFLFSSGIAFLSLAVVRAMMVRTLGRWSRSRFVSELFIDDGVSADIPPDFECVLADELALKPDILDPISLHNFSQVAAGHDRVVVGCPPDRRENWALYLQAIACRGELWMPELAGLLVTGAPNRDELPTVQVSVGPLDLPNRVLKRLLDLSLTIPAILVLSPVMLVVAIAIKLDSSGPVLFRQERMGRNNQLFQVYKFRSMRRERADPTGARSASRDDDRITRVGRIIRSTSIDEIPQLFNVLLGDMALVGPRPHALGSRAGNDLFYHIDRRYWLRHTIKPGITGLAQVRGYRGATDERDDLSNRLRSDLEYVADWSIFRDILILIRTAGVVIHKKAY